MMSNEYVSIHLRPYYTEAYADGYTNGRNPKSGKGMAAFFYGQPDGHPEEDREKIQHMNSAWLVGWFTGSNEWMKENPNPKIEVINEAKPLKEKSSD
ncbi:MAG: hypothetical protein QQN46_07550 [Nitrosopumilus sp.]